jgi:RNA polymerase sigma factor (sigma-70 family)
MVVESAAKALEDFFRRHYRDVVRTVMYTGADEHQAREATAAAMEDLVRSWSRVDHPLPWIRQAAVHHFLKELTRGPDRVRRRLAERGHGADPAGSGSEPSHGADRRWVTELIGSLPPRQAEVMALTVDGYTPQEIAVTLHRTPTAVRQNLFEARRRLRRLMQREEG